MFFKEFPLPKEPVFPSFSVNIKELGARGDGKSDAKPMIDEAMARCNENGGGHIIIPEGTYFCDGPIHFKSHVDLHLEKGAVIRFSDEYEKYLPVVFVRMEGIRCYNYSPLLYGIDLENIAVTGEGTLDGNGFLWWDLMHEKILNGIKPSGKLCDMARDGVPVEARVFGTPEDAIRPYFLQFLRCKNVLIEGVRFIHSPFWTVAPAFCENVIVRGISHKTEKTTKGHTSYNTDTVNMDSCKNCLIEDIVIDSSCDDSICVKSGKDQDGLLMNIPTENVLVRNCRFQNSGGMVVVGSETSGGIRNVCFRNITGIDCIYGIHIKGARGRGNVIENIDFEDIRMERCGEGITIGHVFSHGSGDQDQIPVIRNISLENVTVTESLSGVILRGIPDHPVENLHFKNVQVSGNMVEEISFVEGLHLEGVSLTKNEPFDREVLGGKKEGMQEGM